jgi:excisionase family DNA binding protein
MEETLLTPEQVAGRLQVTPRTIYDWLRQGRLQGIKIGRLWRVRPGDLHAFLADPVAPSANESTQSEARSQPDRTAEEAAASILTLSGDELRQRNEAVIQLLEEWLADETGYDEKVWPTVKRTIEENRSSYRKRFAD